MRTFARRLRLGGEAERRADAERRLQVPGDAVLIRRGPLRSMLMRCPDGCGQTLLVNLDPRAGKAWRLRSRDGEATLYPSVWRDGGCESHFVVWRDRILWCEPEADAGNEEPPADAMLEPRVEALLETERYDAIDALAAVLDESEWDVARACRRLVDLGRAETGPEPHSQRFRLSSPSCGTDAPMREDGNGRGTVATRARTE